MADIPKRVEASCGNWRLEVADAGAEEGDSRVPGAPRTPRRRQTPGWLADDVADPFAARRHEARGDSWPDDAGASGDVNTRSRVPRLTLPSMPSLPRARRAAPPTDGDSAKRRTVIAGATTRQTAVRAPAVVMPRSTRKVPAVPSPDSERDSWQEEDEQFGGWDDWDAYEEGEEPDEVESRGRPRRRGTTAARPLALERVSGPALRAIGRVDAPTDLVPDLAAYRGQSAKVRTAGRPRLSTQALVRTARSPWSMARFALALFAICLGVWTAMSAAGEPSQPLMATWQSASGTHDARAITSLVQPETQGMRPDLYDSTAQFNDWWDAACSSAVSSEVLTAWGVPHATIGKLIDVMQPDVSLNGGLLTPHGFVRGAAAFGYRADISWKLTYKQLLYLTNTLGLPVIVNVRIAYGYYHFFSGGHFLVMTGGDSQGLRIVDSSEYYIKYLPLDTFNSMFTGLTAVIVPNGYTYTLPQG